jgi:hypothetical protein
MTQIAQPQVHLSNLRSRRGLVLAATGALLAAVIAMTLAIGSSHNPTSIPRAAPSASSVDAGPATGTPSAVAQALGSERARSGFSLTTNVPAPPSADAGPVTGTPTAVRDVLSAR